MINQYFYLSESEVPAPMPADDADQPESQAIPEGEELNAIKEPTEAAADGTNGEESAPPPPPPPPGEIVSGDGEKPTEEEISAAPDNQPTEQLTSGEVPTEGALPEGSLCNSFSQN